MGGQFDYVIFLFLKPKYGLHMKNYSSCKNEETLAALFHVFFNSSDFLNLSSETQKDYRKYANKLIPVFGKMLPDNIKPEHIRKYMDKRGLKSKTQANIEKTLLSRVFGWGYERGLVKINPCKGIR